MRNIVTLFIVLLWGGNLMNAQTKISGNITDAEDKKPIPNALVKVSSSDDKKELISYALSDKEGNYSLSFEASNKEIEIIFSLLGYKTESVLMKNESAVLDKQMISSSIDLKEVVVKAPPIINRGDTISYNALHFKSKSDRTIEDILKKMPGITVKKSGQIEYQGKGINKFYIEDMDMLGGKYNLATQNISADAILNVQVYENHQPIRALKDISSSDRASINIKLKNNKMSFPEGNISLGGGYSDKPLYKGDLFGFSVQKKQQILFTLKANNLNRSDIANQLVSHYGRRGVAVKANDLISPISVSAPYIVRGRSGYPSDFIASMNSIRRIDKYSTIKLNTSYKHKRIRDSKKTSSTYYTKDKEINIDEDIESKNINQSIDWGIDYEKNSEKTYLTNAFSGSVDMGDNLVDANSDILHHQQYKMKKVLLNNSLNSIIKTENNSYSFYSNISGGNIPQNRLLITANDKPLPIEQTISGYSISTSSGTYFIKGLSSSSSVSLDLSFESEHDKIISELINKNENEEIRNNERGYKLLSKARLEYKYRVGNFNFSTKIPFEYHNFNYKGLSDFVLNKPTVSPQISLVYLVMPGLKANMSAGISHSFGDISNFLENPIQRSYKHRSLGNIGILVQNKKSHIRLGYDFRNTMEGLFSSLNVDLSRTKNNIMNGSIVADNGSISTLKSNSNTHSDNIITSLYLAKNLQSIGTVVALNMSHIYSKSENLRQNRLTNYSNNNYTIYPSINVNAVDWLSISARGNINFMKRTIHTNLETTASEIYSIGSDLEISVLPFSKFEIYSKLSYCNIPLQNDTRENLNFVDCGMRWQPGKLVQVDLDFYNLTNIKTYTNSTYIQQDKFVTRYAIRPLSFVLSVRINY